MRVLHLSDIHFQRAWMAPNAALCNGVSAPDAEGCNGAAAPDAALRNGVSTPDATDRNGALSPDAAESCPRPGRMPACAPVPALGCDEGFYAGILARVGDTRRLLAEAVRAAAARGPIDAVVVTGDMTHAGDADDMRSVRDALDRALAEVGAAQAPVLATPGNHDARAAFIDGWHSAGELLPDGTVCARIEVADETIAAIDSSDAAVPEGSIGTVALGWLAANLADAACAGRRVLVATHHHVCAAQSDMPACRGAVALLELLARYDAELLCGHTHHALAGEAAGVVYHTAPALSFQGDASCRDEAPWLFEDAPAQASKVVRFHGGSGYAIYDVHCSHVARSSVEMLAEGYPLGQFYL